MRESITTAGELIGATVFSVGVFLFSPALGCMTIGLSVGLFSWLAAR